ncbi:type II secretion system protein [Clostridium sp. MB40-C1]|uniref:type II secretion system protein n=1 Tax=Clostridium sp. MB40-C1 TaxID=3070996 RepID=UPI0027E2157C|nr:type II secretion system protein [Clostridium sp. MB40-C1]WMJ80839.1 type II secretion system protein [Clostridium sp. MB40-C1]
MKGLRRISKKKKGFTLIELIIVIAILGILAFIVVPNFKGHKDDAKKSADEANGKIIADATAMAITKDEIKLVDGSYVGTTKKENNADYSSYIQVDEEKTPEVAKQLRTIPKVSGTDDKFYLIINKDGKITVSKEDNDNGKVYPVKDET